MYVCAFWCIVTLVYINLFFQVGPAFSQFFNLLAVCLYQHLLLGIGKIPKPVVLNFFWNQGLVSWKIAFPWTGWAAGVVFRMIQPPAVWHSSQQSPRPGGWGPLT